MQANRITLIYVLLMTAVVVASNVLVQYPLSGELFGIALGDLLTYGAFTYPVAFLITDLTNRQFGPRVARRVVAAGFVVAVAFSFAVAALIEGRVDAAWGRWVTVPASRTNHVITARAPSIRGKEDEQNSRGGLALSNGE